METKIIDLIKRDGPLTGAELHSTLGGDGFGLWKSCMQSTRLSVMRTGTRYLRLDRQVDGFARLSPSILREFLTYCVIGLEQENQAVLQKAQSLTAHIHTVTRYKRTLAHSLISDIMNRMESSCRLDHHLCVIIAGDIVYDMAHNVPRPERSTGKMVTGSDIDLIVVIEDGLPQEVVMTLDRAIYQEKYRALINPSVKEEMDYIVKRVERIREQVAFNSFKKMVACKILQEGNLLYGSAALFKTVKDLLATSGVIQKLDALHQKAEIFRKNAETALLNLPPHRLDPDSLYLFYTAEESEEFE